MLTIRRRTSTFTQPYTSDQKLTTKNALPLRVNENKSSSRPDLTQFDYDNGFGDRTGRFMIDLYMAGDGGGDCGTWSAAVCDKPTTGCRDSRELFIKSCLRALGWGWDWGWGRVGVGWGARLTAHE